MIVVAVLVLAAVIALVIAVVVEGGEAVTVEALGSSVHTTVLGVFAAGLVAGLVLVGALALLAFGVRQVQARRREIDYLRKKIAEHERADEPDAQGEGPVSEPSASSWVPERGPVRRSAPSTSPEPLRR
ncbi:hypothetical protein [Phytoactinopolyspora limicola]|uniref:hypothetical protein n=1 Tax=Phytoactinopolyspora limicola TaxID=2715536 RepID=UPI00140C36B1|nr:hypothetical protein [Phytoactinopolyspora limicola]